MHALETTVETYFICLLHVGMCMCAYSSMPTLIYLWRSEDSLREIFLAFYCVPMQAKSAVCLKLALRGGSGIRRAPMVRLGSIQS